MTASTPAAATAPVVRRLDPLDRASWRTLWEAYLRFYRAPLPEEVTRSTFDALCSGRDLVGLVAEADGALVGLAHAVLHPTTWATRPTCYLEDLYVTPASRGSGAARALVEGVYALADERGAATTYWHTQEYNAAARSLYDVLGRRTSFIVYERQVAQQG